MDFYENTGEGTCATGTSYASGATCTVSVTFQPLYPGLRRGAVVLTDSTNTVLATTYIWGVGNGAIVAFDPGSENQVGDFQRPVGVAHDKTGDLYIVDQGASKIYEIPESTGTQTALSGFTLNTPAGIAVDGAGNVYVADSGLKEVLELAAGATTQSIVGGTCASGSTLLTCNMDTPTGVAVDGDGNLYIADSSATKHTPQVIKVTPAGNQTSVVSTGLGAPVALALDSAGNIYIADQGYSGGSSTVSPQVLKIWADGATPQSTISTGSYTLTTPNAVAVDAAGDIFIADYGAARVLKVPVTGSTTTVDTGLVNPSGLAWDDAGNLYIADAGQVNLLKWQRDTPPTSLTFASTTVGSTSVAQDVTITNDGNKPLTFSALAVADSNFTLGSSGTPCSLSTNVAAGSSCTLAVEFTPTTAGTLSSSVTFTTNYVTNGSTTTTQSIALSGTATAAALLTQATLTIINMPTTAQANGTTFTVSTSGGNGSGAVTYAATGACSVNATSGLVTMTASSGTCSVTATKAGDATYNPTTSAAATVSATSPATTPAPSISSMSPLVVTAGHSAFTLTVNGTNFISGTAVQWNGSARSTTVVSGTQLTATITAADVASVGTAQVTAASSSGTSPAFVLAIDSSSSGSSTSINLTAQATTLNVQAGQAVSDTVTFNGAASGSQITAACQNLPTGATCSFDSSTKTVTIQTAASTPAGQYQVLVIFTVTQQTVAQVRRQPLLLASWTGLMGLPLGLLCWTGTRKKAIRLVVLGLLGLCLCLSLACGGGSSTSSTTSTARTTQTSMALTVNVQ